MRQSYAPQVRHFVALRRRWLPNGCALWRTAGTFHGAMEKWSHDPSEPGRPYGRAVKARKAVQVADLRQTRATWRATHWWLPGLMSRASAPWSPFRCSRMMNWSGPSPFIARRCARLPTSRSSWSRTSRPRPSSLSRTRGCSTSCASARRSQRVAGAADRNSRGAQGHQQFARRTRAGVPGHAGERDHAFARPSSAFCFGSTMAWIPRGRDARRAAGVCRILAARAAAAGSANGSRSRHADEADVHIADVMADPAYLEGEPVFVAAVKLGGARTILLVPMLKEDELIGAIAIYRQEVRPFTDKQIELVAELRRPGRHRHREYAAAQRAARIASAADRHRRRAQGHQPLDLRSARPCCNTLVESAARLCDADMATILAADERQSSITSRATAYSPNSTNT